MNLAISRRKILFWPMAAVSLALAGCGPKIYSFEPSVFTTGQNGRVQLNWRVKGDAFLLIHDINYPGSGTEKLHDLTLILTHRGKDSGFLLRAEDTLKLPVASEDSVAIIKQPDGFTDDILRYFTLVVRLEGHYAIKTKQVEVRVDSASDQIGFTPKQMGDSLIAADTNNITRWGHAFEIFTVSTSDSLPLVVTHSNTSRTLVPGGKPEEGFKGTPVEGYWSFGRLMTPEEKTGSQRLPHMLIINITIKHR